MSFNSTVVIIAKFEFLEHFRNRWLLLYGSAFCLLGNMIMYFGGANPLQAAGSLLSLVLLLVPIYSLVFGCISFMESLPFMEQMTTQPISRRDVYLGKYLGLSTSLSLSFFIGMGLAILMRLNSNEKGVLTLVLLLALGVMLSFIFVSVSFFLANVSKRKEVVFGLALCVWFYFFVLHDLIMFGVVVSFGDYPLEWLIWLMSLLNPIDLSRVLVSLQMDFSSLMGASAAVMNKSLGGTRGIILGLIVLCFWIVVPLLAGIRRFFRRDF